MLTFEPLKPAHTAGFQLQWLRIHVRDHKLRELPIKDRTLEANYECFVLTQARKGIAEARRWALETRYGPVWRDAQIAGFAGRVFELGPEPEPDDIDGRSPAVVVWHDGEMFYFIASYEMSSDSLIPVGISLYKPARNSRARPIGARRRS
jgi:hypothetical protein